MPGRVEIDDVAPVVSCGAYPAKAVVDEVIPVRASVWREGHDAVAATLVVRYLGPRYPQVGETRRLKAVQAPALAESAVEPVVKVKPLHVPMAPDGVEPFVFHGAFTPDADGLWTYRVDGWGDPIHTWRHAVEAKLDAGQGESELSNDLLVGAQLLKRAATAGVKGTMLEPVTPHGMRAGFVTTAYRNGVSDEEIMGHTRHRGLTTMRSYVRRAKLGGASPSGNLDL